MEISILGLLCLVAVAAAECGIKPDQVEDNYIVGGRDAKKGNWPWQLSLQIKNPNTGNFSHTCGASILNEDWALTAAHCVHNRGGPEDFRVVAGAHNIKNMDGTEQVICIEKIIKHEKYSQISVLGYPNDICLLRLAGKIDLTADNIGTACLANSSHGDFVGNKNCWISGWGITNWVNSDIPEILQEAKVPIPTNKDCKKSFIMLRDTHICSGDGKPSACRGDSGGPMTCKVGDKWFVNGVASFGIVFCSGVPMVYTRVSSYTDWVDSTMKANSK